MTEDRCTHPHTDLRKRTARNGTVHYVRQCLICGNEAAAVPIKELSPAEMAAAPEKDEAISRRYWELRSREYAEKRERELAERRRQYSVYLDSPEWEERRRIRLRLDEHLCQARLRGCTRRATQVHHLTYQFLFNEPIFTLVSVCRGCHEQISEMEGRIRRSTEITAKQQTA